MHSQILLATTLIGLSAAAALPSFNSTLVARDACPAGQYCDQCVIDNTCGTDTVTLGIMPDEINVGDVNLDDIGNVIAQQCYIDSGDGFAGCNPTEVDIPTTLPDGNSGTIKVTVTTGVFQGWAKDLFVAGIKAALAGTVKKNTSTTDQGNSITTSTIPPSFFIALRSDEDRPVTIGMKVVEDPNGSGCGDILALGAAVAGVAGPYGDAIGAALTFGSVLCGS